MLICIFEFYPPPSRKPLYTPLGIHVFRALLISFYFSNQMQFCCARTNGVMWLSTLLRAKETGYIIIQKLIKNVFKYKHELKINCLKQRIKAIYISLELQVVLINMEIDRRFQDLLCQQLALLYLISRSSLSTISIVIPDFKGHIVLCLHESISCIVDVIYSVLMLYAIYVIHVSNKS